MNFQGAFFLNIFPTMYYLIQSNIYSDPEHNRVFEVLENLELDYETIELNKNTGKIDLKSDRKDVFVYGSVKLARLSRVNSDWNPGSFYGGNHKFEEHSKFYKTHLLNYQTQVFKFGEAISWKDNEEKFIKPHQDAKVFTGRVFTQLKWEDFVKDALENPKTDMLHADTLVQMSQPQNLVKEARLWVVGKQVIGGVYYKFHGDQPFEREVEEEAIKFAQEMVGLFNVADAFVMDVGLTDEGWKIVEINCVNSAGFYHFNPRTLFRALEIYFND